MGLEVGTYDCDLRTTATDDVCTGTGPVAPPSSPNCFDAHNEAFATPTPTPAAEQIIIAPLRHNQDRAHHLASLAGPGWAGWLATELDTYSI